MITINNIHFRDFKLISLLYHDYEFVQEKIYLLQKYMDFSKTVNVLYFESVQYMQDKIPVKLPKWIKGVSSIDSICLLSPDAWDKDYVDSESLTQIFIHEYVHVAVFNTFTQICPLWLNEGLAQNIAEQNKKNERKSICEKFDYYKSNYQNDNFYYQSANIVSYLIQEYGLKDVISHGKNCKNFESDSIFGVENLQRIEDYMREQNEIIT